MQLDDFSALHQELSRTQIEQSLSQAKGGLAELGCYTENAELVFFDLVVLRLERHFCGFSASC